MRWFSSYILMLKVRKACCIHEGINEKGIGMGVNEMTKGFG